MGAIIGAMEAMELLIDIIMMIAKMITKLIRTEIMINMTVIMVKSVLWI